MDIQKLMEQGRQLNIQVGKETGRQVGNCEVCDNFQVLTEVGMCGPCTFGEADTINGNW